MKHLLIKNKALLFALTWLMTSSVVWASEGKEPEPDIWGGDIFTSIFALLLFAAMFFVLKKYAWSPILSGLHGREEYIGQQIKDAEKMKSDADKSLRRYEARLAKAEERAKEIIEQAREDAEKISKKITDDAQLKAQEIVNQSTAALNTARSQAVRDLHQYSAELAVDLAAKILGKSIDANEHRQLIDSTISQLQQDS